VQRGLQPALRIAPQNHVAKSLNFLVPGAPHRRGSAPAVFVAIRHAAVDGVNAVQLTAELAPLSRCLSTAHGRWPSPKGGPMPDSKR
jgi:hypothetical protein